MYEEIIINYFHPAHNIGMQDIRNVWLLEKKTVKLKTTTYRGSLIFRFPKSGRRISYRTLKNGLIRKKIILKFPVELLPF